MHNKKPSWADIVKAESSENEQEGTSALKKRNPNVIKKKSTSRTSIEPLKGTTLHSPPTLPCSSSSSSSSSVKSSTSVQGKDNCWGIEPNFSEKYKESTKPDEKSSILASAVGKGDEDTWWRLEKSHPTRKKQSTKTTTTTNSDFSSSSSAKSSSSPMHRKLDSFNDSSRKSTHPTIVPTGLHSLQPRPMLRHSVESIRLVTLMSYPYSPYLENQGIFTNVNTQQMTTSSLHVGRIQPRNSNNSIRSPKKDPSNVMSISLFTRNFPILPYTNYVLSSDMYTLVCFLEDTIKIVKTHRKLWHTSIKTPSPVQAVTTCTCRLMVLTKTRQVLIYDLRTGDSLCDNLGRLGVKQKDVLDVCGIILHDYDNVTFVINDSLWAVNLQDLENPKMIAENVKVLNERSMWVAYSTAITWEAIAEEEGAEEEGAEKERKAPNRSINVYDVAKGTVKEIRTVTPNTYVTASEECLYLLNNEQLEVYDMVNEKTILELIIKDIQPGDLIKYNSREEVWVLKADPKSLRIYSAHTGNLCYHYDFDMNGQVVYPNDDWSAFQIGEDLTSLNDLLIARFDNFGDASGLQLILPQRSRRLRRVEFNGRTVLQVSTNNVDLVDVISESLPTRQPEANSVYSHLWIRGIYTATLTPQSTIFHQFYNGYNITGKPLYKAHSPSSQNAVLIFTKKLHIGKLLAFFEWKDDSSEAMFPVSCYHLSESGATPKWTTKISVVDVPNSPYIWDINGGNLLDAFYGHVVLRTDIKQARAFCTLKGYLHVLVADELLSFRLPAGTPSKAKPMTSLIEKIDYSQCSAITSISTYSSSGSIILFNGFTGRVELRKPFSMQLETGVDLGLTNSMLNDGDSASFIWGGNGGKQQLWLRTQSKARPFSLYRIDLM